LRAGAAFVPGGVEQDGLLDTAQSGEEFADAEVQADLVGLSAHQVGDGQGEDTVEDVNPEVDPTPERELHHRLTGVLVEDAEPDPHTALLVSLLSALGLVRGLVDKEHRAKDIARECATASATSAAVSRSVQALQSAIMVAVIIPTITTTTN
jgi:Golgi phosphoprotein 3 (GPP34)